MDVVTNISTLIVYGPIMFLAYLYYLQYDYCGPYLQSSKPHIVIKYPPLPRKLYLIQHRYGVAKQNLYLISQFCVTKLPSLSYIFSFLYLFLKYIYVFFILFFGYLAIQIKFKILIFFNKYFLKKKLEENKNKEEELDELVL